jgi:hypothetical protein
MREEMRQELGKPHWAPAGGKLGTRYAVIEARTGETLKQTRPKPDERCGNPEKEGEAEPGKGKARRMPMGCLIRHSTPSTGKPCTWGRT